MLIEKAMAVTEYRWEEFWGRGGRKTVKGAEALKNTAEPIVAFEAQGLRTRRSDFHPFPSASNRHYHLSVTTRTKLFPTAFHKSAPISWTQQFEFIPIRLNRNIRRKGGHIP